MAEEATKDEAAEVSAEAPAEAAVAEPAASAAEVTEAAEATEAAEPVEAAATEAVEATSEVAAAESTAETVEAAEAVEGDDDAEVAEGAEAAGEGAEEIAPPKPKNDNPNLKWYVVHTYSGYEKKAKKSLQEGIRRAEAEKLFGDLEEEILIPVEEVVEMKKGEKKTSERKLFPGYMLVRMEMTDETWHLVKSTPKITGFIGSSSRPAPISELELRKITRQMEEGVQKPKPKIEFEQGEEVQVIDGPFMNFNGVVEEVKPEKGKVRVMVSIFGRRTPVELDFMQIEKL